ncbi:hypothetical protein ACFQ1I_31405 [Kitasatospora arboriphila]
MTPHRDGGGAPPGRTVEAELKAVVRDPAAVRARLHALAAPAGPRCTGTPTTTCRTARWPAATASCGCAPSPARRAAAPC